MNKGEKERKKTRNKRASKIQKNPLWLPLEQMRVGVYILVKLRFVILSLLCSFGKFESSIHLPFSFLHCSAFTMKIPCLYRAFHRFAQSKICNGGSCQFLILPQLPQKMTPCFKSGQNWLKNNHLASLIYVNPWHTL